MATSVRFLQFLNADKPIISRFFGSFRSLMPLESKAQVPISVTVSGIVTYSIISLLSKTIGAIYFTPSGIFTVLSVPLYCTSTSSPSITYFSR